MKHPESKDHFQNHVKGNKRKVTLFELTHHPGKHTLEEQWIRIREIGANPLINS